MRVLLQNGMDANHAVAVPGQRSHAITFAAGAGHGAALAILVNEGGVDPACTKSAGGYAPIHIAARCNQVKIVALLVEKFNVPVDLQCKCEGFTALHTAVNNGQLGMATILVAKLGADVDSVKNLRGQSALQLAKAQSTKSSRKQSHQALVNLLTLHCRKKTSSAGADAK